MGEAIGLSVALPNLENSHINMIRLKTYLFIAVTALPSIAANAADSDQCLDLARAGIMSGAQEDVCKLKGNLKERLKELYRANGCGQLVAAKDLNKASAEIASGMRSEYAQSGEKQFCRAAQDSYNETQKEYFSAAKSPAAPAPPAISHVLYMAVIDENLRPTEVYDSKEECESSGKDGVATFRKRLLDRGASEAAKRVKYKCEPLLK